MATEHIGKILASLPAASKAPPTPPKWLPQWPAQQRPCPKGISVERSRVSQSRYDALKRKLDAGQWPLYFYGETGRGKTFAAAMIYAEWPAVIGAPVRPQFWPAAKIIGDLIESRFSGGATAIQKTCEAAGLIVIDDIIDRNMTDARCAALLD